MMPPYEAGIFQNMAFQGTQAFGRLNEPIYQSYYSRPSKTNAPCQNYLPHLAIVYLIAEFVNTYLSGNAHWNMVQILTYANQVQLISELFSIKRFDRIEFCASLVSRTSHLWYFKNVLVSTITYPTIFCLKFGYFAKATKFLHIFHLKFDATK